MNLDALLRPSGGGKRPVVAVPGPGDPDILACVAEAMQRRLADFLLVGRRPDLERAAAGMRMDLAATELVPAEDEHEACERAADLVQEGRAQVLMKGLVATAAFTHAILDKKRGFVPAGGLISQVAMFEVPAYHKLLFITDAAINIIPDLEAKTRILANALAVARSLGIERPKAAVICPVEKVKDKIPSTLHARDLRKLAADGDLGACSVDGPLALDVALSRRAAAIKGVKSPVAGDSDILLLPDLDTGNVLYKSLTMLAGARTAAVVAGVKVPVILTSRTDSEETRLLSLGLALHLAGTMRYA